MTRKEAIALKLYTYTTGKPCKRGHTTERDTLEGYCIECKREYQNAYQKKQRAEIRAALKG